MPIPNLQLVALFLLSTSLCPPGETAQQPSAADAPDWPAVIAKLRQQLDGMSERAAVREQLAVAYNNYAVSLADQGRLDDAVRQLEEAVHIDPSSVQFRNNLALIHLKAAQTAYQAHQTQRAKQALDRAIAAMPTLADAYVLLGELEYNSQRLKEAEAAWQKALTLDSTRLDVRKKLERLSQERPVESQFEKLSQLYFDIRYTEGLARSAGFDIQEALLKARREVGSDFACRPTQKLVVLVYSTEQFRRLRQDTPEWVGGQYDGKIRVPLPSQEFDRARVTRILFHEYTHVVIHELTGDRLPTWFNEGLAEYEAWKGETPPWSLLRQALAKGRLIPWADLSTQLSPSRSAQEAALAYEQSHSIARYLVQRYSFWRIKQLLKTVAAGTSLEEALPAQFHLKQSRLEENWLTWLRETLAS